MGHLQGRKLRHGVGEWLAPGFAELGGFPVSLSQGGGVLLGVYQHHSEFDHLFWNERSLVGALLFGSVVSSYGTALSYSVFLVYLLHDLVF